MVNNYPDDIRQHDDNPDSPFYDDSREEWVDVRAEKIAEELLSETGYQSNGATYDISDLLEEIANSELMTKKFEQMLRVHLISGSTLLQSLFRVVAMDYALKLAADELAAKESDCDN